MDVFKAVLRPVAVAAAALLLISCAHDYRLLSPAEIADLPRSEGMNGGSFVAEIPWEYLGSDSKGHSFRHYYNRGNQLCYSRVTIPRANAVLHFQEFPRGSRRQWVTLTPETAIFEFYPQQEPAPHS